MSLILLTLFSIFLLGCGEPIVIPEEATGYIKPSPEQLEGRRMSAEEFRNSRRGKRRSTPPSWEAGYSVYDEYPNCYTKDTMNQNPCGNCWLVSTSQAFADRLCIAYEKDGRFDTSWYTSLQPSIEMFTNCFNDQVDAWYQYPGLYNPCYGGYAGGALHFLERNGAQVKGAVQTACWLYDGTYSAAPPGTGRPPCVGDNVGETCPDNPTAPWTDDWDDDRIWVSDYGQVGNPSQDDIKQEIFDRGPVIVSIKTYTDFKCYPNGCGGYEFGCGGSCGGYHANGDFADGVYYQRDGGVPGGHAIILTGWGQTGGGVNYWIRATDEVELEDDFWWHDVEVNPPVCSLTCYNGGYCTKPDSASCTCTSGYVGYDAYCRCTTNFCQNGGTCSGVDMCSGCDEGWTGNDCNSPECDPGYCQNGGTCCGEDLCCDCDEGFDGDDCSQPLYDCDPNPGFCQNGGWCCGTDVCCDCDPGWTGSDCSTSECSAGYCKNGGSCCDPDLCCECNSGWTGTTCETSQCDDGYCMNGGSCNGVNSCDCTYTGYTGYQCNITTSSGLGDDQGEDDDEDDQGSSSSAVVGGIVGGSVAALGLGTVGIISIILCCGISLLCCLVLLVVCLVLLVGGIGGAGVAIGAMKGGSDDHIVNDFQLDDINGGGDSKSSPATQNVRRNSMLKRASLRPDNIKRATRKASEVKRESIRKVMGRREDVKRHLPSPMMNRPLPSRSNAPPPQQQFGSRFNNNNAHAPPPPKPASRWNAPPPKPASRWNNNNNPPPAKPASRWNNNNAPPKPASRFNQPAPSRWNKPPPKPASRWNNNNNRQQPPVKPKPRVLFEKKTPPTIPGRRNVRPPIPRGGRGGRPPVMPNRGNRPPVGGQRGGRSRPVIPRRNY